MKRFMRERVTILRESDEVKSDSGFVSNQYGELATNVQCSIQQNSEMFRQTERGEILTSTATGVFYPSQDIVEGDVVQTQDGAQFIVRSVNNVAGHHIETQLERNVGDVIAPEP